MTQKHAAVPSPDKSPPLSWMERHGALLLSAGLGLVLVLVLMLDRLVRH